ncbi:MAG: four helix bundle protein [Terrimicrobiaceae bacterium]
MKIRTHKDLRVWQEAMDLAMEIFKLSKRFPSDERFSLADQIPRSVPANISEAWRKRRYAAAFVSKLNDAEGEAAESQTHLEIARRCGYLTDEESKQLDDRYEALLAQLVTMANRPEVWTAGRPDNKTMRNGDKGISRPQSPSPQVPKS